MGSDLAPRSSSVPPVDNQNDKSSVTAEAEIRIRKLVKNLPRDVVFQKVREAGRLASAGKREQGFYLLDLQRRKLYLDAGCSTFQQYIRTNTDLQLKEANELVRISRALEELTAIGDAFDDGLIHWGAVRAMIRIAIPRTEREWIDYARHHTVNEVERRVAFLKRGDRPRDPSPFKSAPVWFLHQFKASPQLHQAIEGLMAVLTKLWGHPVTEEEALLFACQIVLSLEIQADANRAASGEERKLPSTYRLVIILCEFCRQFMALLPEGPERIDPEVARKLIEGAEVVDLRKAESAAYRKAGEAGCGHDHRNQGQERSHMGPPAPEVVVPQGAVPEEFGEGPAVVAWEQTSPPAAEVPPPASDGTSVADTRSDSDAEAGAGGESHGTAGDSIDGREKQSHMGPPAPEVVVEQGSVPEGSEDRPTGESSEAPKGLVGELPVPGLPSWAKSGPLVPADPNLRIQHAPNLSTRDRPTVPLEKRASRSSAELIKLVLTRAGYFCAIPGCTNLAEFAHHMEWWSQGGPTDILHLIAVCKACHDAGIHAGYILLSGTADKLIVSRKDGRPVASGATVIPVKLEREPDPATVPSGGETSGGDPSGDSLPVDPSDTDRPTAGPAVGTAPSLVIPAEISPAWWLEHRHCFEWSERQRALVLRPGEEAPIGPAVIFEDPPGAPPVPSTPSASPSDPDLLDAGNASRGIENLVIEIYAPRARFLDCSSAKSCGLEGHVHSRDLMRIETEGYRSQAHERPSHQARADE